MMLCAGWELARHLEGGEPGACSASDSEVMKLATSGELGGVIEPALGVLHQPSGMHGVNRVLAPVRNCEMVRLGAAAGE